MNTLYLAEKVCLLWSKPGVTCKLAVLGWPPVLWIYGFNLWTSFHKVLLSPHTFLTLARCLAPVLPRWQLALLQWPLLPSRQLKSLSNWLFPSGSCESLALSLRKGVRKQWQPSIPSRSWNKRVSRTKAYPILILINYKGLTVADF